MPQHSAGTLRAALTDLVVGDAACAEHAAERIDAGGSRFWDDAIDVAVRWGLVGQLRERMGRRLPPESAEKLRSAAIAMAARSTYVIHNSAGALAILADSGIESVTIKGVGLIAALGRNPATRPTGDLDVVVRGRDAEHARRLFRDAGFREINPEFEYHMASIARSRQLHNFARALERDGFEIDLHWQFGPTPPFALDAGRLIERGRTAKLGALDVRVADPVDGVLINAHHALRGSFNPYNTVRDLCDLKLWWDAGEIEPQLDSLFDIARRSGLAPTLLALWSAILRRDPAHTLRSGHARLAAFLSGDERNEAALMERLFEEQLVVGTPSHFTLEVFAPRVFARSVAAAAARAVRRARGAEAVGHVEPHRPMPQRIMGLVPRFLRVIREMSRLRSLRAYRTVARAQSRFH